MTTAAPQYPFDPTGQATSNLVAGERQTINPPDWSDFYTIVPAATPYFAASLTLTLVGTGRVLVEGVDYNPTHRFYDASLQCASPVYGSITFLDKTLSGVVELQYNTLGGDWTLNSDQIATILANTLMNPLITTWEEVVNLPYQFPPVSHSWDIVDMVGASDIVDALNNMVTALLQSGDTGLAQHLADFNNPHRVTAAQVALGNVQNYPMATSADAIAGSSNALYMTPNTVQIEIQQFAILPLNAHINNTTNPHDVTAAQVGLGNVQNYGLASTAQAQAGTVNNVYMTPALVAAAIATQALGPLNTHVANLNNPHQVSATQVGLGNVPNYPMATQQQASAGTETNAFMSPALVMSVMQSGAGGNLQAHIDDHNNPHQVTATQVALGNVMNYPIATLSQAQGGVDNASYMTPSLTSAAITVATATFTAHLSDTDNPHAVTADQVGLGNVQNYAMATEAAATAGADTTSYMSPYLTAVAVTALAVNPLNDHLADFDNPHEVTAAQVGAATPSDLTTAIDALSTVYLGIADTAANSAQLEGQTLAQVVDTVVAAVGLTLTYPAYAGTADQSWTLLATQLTTTPQDTGPVLPPLIFEVSGGDGWNGEVVGGNDSSLFRIVSNANDPLGISITQLSGFSAGPAIGYVYNPILNTLNLYLRSSTGRSSVVMRFYSDSASSFFSSPTISDTEPTNIVYPAVKDESLHAANAVSSAGQVAWGLPNGSNLSSFCVDRDTLVQRINVIDDIEDVATVNAVSQSWGAFWANSSRLASYGPEAYRASSLLGWKWDSTVPALTYTPTNTSMVSIVSETQTSGSMTFEALVSSTDLSDMGLGLVAGFTDASGQPAMISVMRDCGGLTTLTDTLGAIPSRGEFNLFTVGFNLFQNDGFVMAASSTNLTWGDAVADADRASTPYVPQVTTSGTNGWNGHGAVAIKIVFAGTTLTISTSDFGAVAGSVTYVNTQTIDLSTYSWHPGVASVLRALQSEGARWGFTAFQTPSASFAISSAPESYKRYIVRSEDANGNETSMLSSYDGAAWVDFALVDQVMVKPGRFYYSDVNNRLYHALRDGSLEAVQLVAYTPEGTSILTT